MSPVQHSELVWRGISAAWYIGCIAYAAWSWRRGPRTVGNGCWIAIAMFAAILVGVVAYQVFRSARLKAADVVCEQNMKQLSQALLEYASAHHDHLPPANAWATDIMPYLSPDDRREAFHCPYAASPYSYAFNKALGGVSTDDLSAPSDTVTLFECDAKSLNAAGGPSDVSRARQWGHNNVAFLDGHVQSSEPWNPAFAASWRWHR